MAELEVQPGSIFGAARQVVVVLVLLVLAPAVATAAGRNVTFGDESGRPMTATIFEANHLPAPAVILVPALGHPRDEWRALAQRFAEQDITALTIDLPGTVVPDEPGQMAGWSREIRSAVTWLVAQPNVRPEAIAVAGSSLGGSLAAIAAAADPRIHAVALVSPSIDYRGLRIEAPLRQVGSRPVLFVASRRDSYSARSVRELTRNAPGPRETYLGESASHGVALLAAEPDLARMLVDWFQWTLGVH